MQTNIVESNLNSIIDFLERHTSGAGQLLLPLVRKTLLEYQIEKALPVGPMSAEEYQKWTDKTALYPKDAGILYSVIGLANEAGETLGVVKKMIRDDGGKLTDEKRKKLMDETADTLWYAARICTELGITMGDLFKLNHDKLEDRLARNVIQGSGDNR